MLQFERVDHIKFTPPSSSEYDPSRKEGFNDLDSIIISSLVALAACAVIENSPCQARAQSPISLAIPLQYIE